VIDDRVPPQDLAAEQALLGGMMLSRDVIPPVVALFGEHGGTVFYRPAHQTIYDTIADMHAAGTPVDALTVSKELHRRGHLMRVGGGPYLHTLIASVPTAANATYYAEIVAEKATLRRVIEAGMRITQLGWQGAEVGEVDEVILRAHRAIDEALANVESPAADGPMSLADLLAQPDLPRDWIIPGLLERGDRLILTGHEGHGKSILVAQLALSIAAGLNPFTGAPIKMLDGGEYRVLVIDVENTERQVKRRYLRMVQTIDGIRARAGLDPVDWGRAVSLDIRPEGIDITKPAEIARIERFASIAKPDLIVAGPLYKMAGHSIHEEEGAIAFFRTMDRLRVRHNCALISEHHTGHAQNGQERGTRPIGSSAILRWPEFGLGIARHPDGDPDEEHPTWVKVMRWRGGREERAWPRELRWGGRDRLPWVPGDGYEDELRHYTDGV
jgi:hypothetical protein